MAYLELHGVSIALGGRDVVCDVDAEAHAGELVVVVGPNGAGKTTLLRAIAGLAEPRAGTMRVLGRDPLRTPRRVIARELAYLPQHYELAFPFAVEEVVLLGRYARQTGLGLADDDLAAARRAMAACDVAHLASRRFDELSGGEARRVIGGAALVGAAGTLVVVWRLAGIGKHLPPATLVLVPLHHLPTGAVTSVLGVPFFVAILVGQKQRAALWGRG